MRQIHRLKPGHGNTVCNSDFNYSKAFLSLGFEPALHDCTVELSLGGSISRLRHEIQSLGQYCSCRQRAPSRPVPANLRRSTLPLSSPGQATDSPSLSSTRSVLHFWKRPSIFARKLPFSCKNRVSPQFCYWWFITSQQTRTTKRVFS